MLEQPDVAGHERRRGEPHRLPQREVPRHDREHDAQRLVTDEGAARFHFARVGEHLVGQQRLCLLREPVARGRALVDLGARRDEGLAHLGGHERRETLAVGGEQLTRGVQPPGPLGVRRGAVGLGRVRCPRQPRLDLAAASSASNVRTVSPVAGLVVAIAMPHLLRAAIFA